MCHTMPAQQWKSAAHPAIRRKFSSKSCDPKCMESNQKSEGQCLTLGCMKHWHQKWHLGHHTNRASQQSLRNYHQRSRFRTSCGFLVVTAYALQLKDRWYPNQVIPKTKKWHFLSASLELRIIRMARRKINTQKPPGMWPQAVVYIIFK